tara:strand:+ start:262 stop:399 length:138 start_codon:yes stop_codon:yes gene_type:complete
MHKFLCLVVFRTASDGQLRKASSGIKKIRRALEQLEGEPSEIEDI